MRSRWEIVVDDCLREREERPERVAPEALRAAVAAAHGVTIHEMAGKSRHVDVVRARETFASLAHEWCGLSYPEASRWLGRRNHATAWCAAQRFGRRADREESVRNVRATLRAGRGRT